MFNFAGLTTAQAEESRQKHGSNRITPQETETFWDKLADNFRDPMIVILVVALVIVTILALFGFTEWYEGVGIAVAVGLATLVATASEFKNEQTFQKLQEEAGRIRVNVFRNGSLGLTGIDDVVVGDHILLQSGDKIPADGRILKGHLKVNQAALTGEPAAVLKTPVPDESDESGESGERDEHIGVHNPHRVFRGTIVEDGEAVMVVERVGDQTELGRLADALATDERIGPLQVKLGVLADQIARFGYIAASFIAAAFLYKALWMDNGGDWNTFAAYAANWQQLILDIVTALILAVIIIVVAVPEGLPMMIAIVLAQNMHKLLKSNVLVRQLLGMETSGSLNLLFSDKTGTITRGKLEATGFAGAENAADTLTKYSRFEDIPAPLARLLDLSFRENTSCVLNCDAEKVEERILGGNATERALLRFVGADRNACAAPTGVILRQTLFNSVRKFSAARIRTPEGEELTLIKGAAERILEKSVCRYLADGTTEILDEARKNAIAAVAEAWAEDGYRLIGVAVTETDVPDDIAVLPDGLNLLGLALIRDELRETSAPALATLRRAGIRVVMLTGDRSGTAKAVAREAGLLSSASDLLLRSDDMAAMSDEDLKEALPRIKVVSRCLPRDKTRLVKIAQDAGLVVGMTGDGVNDSPALANADIGFGLGSGAEVAREAADIVVLDDDIQSITNAVHYGRTIYRNIQKFITFQLTVNAAAIAIAFIGPFIGVRLPFTMIQLLWVNLIMDTLAALAFSGEPPLSAHMAEKPKRRDEHLITPAMWSSILGNGFFMTVICVGFLKIGGIRDLFRSPEAFMTAFFGVFVFLNNFNKFNVRVDGFNLFAHISRNRGFLQVVALIFFVHALITIFGGDMFRTVPLTAGEWGWVLLFSVLIIPFDLLRKYICWIFD